MDENFATIACKIQVNCEICVYHAAIIFTFAFISFGYMYCNDCVFKRTKVPDVVHVIFKDTGWIRQRED